ncbi:lupeol synthase-like [Fagus crenata]
MWKLKIIEVSEGPWLMSVNNYLRREYWEFDLDARTPEERAQVVFREEFRKNRFKTKQSSDLLMQMQLRKENPGVQIAPPMKVKTLVDVTEDAVKTTLKRAVGFLSSIQTHDGHWTGDIGGLLFTMPHFSYCSICILGFHFIPFSLTNPAPSHSIPSLYSLIEDQLVDVGDLALQRGESLTYQ